MKKNLKKEREHCVPAPYLSMLAPKLILREEILG